VIFYNLFVLNYLLCTPYAAWNVWYHINVWFRAPTDPCALLISSWVTIAVRGPFVLYFVGYPLLHIVMTIERGWATLRVHHYENAPHNYGILSVTVV
ncbi:hypothetical protein AAVH_36182, partial [Aphelenchoides avenae]